MKKIILLFLLVVVGLSSEVYGQKPRKFPKGYEIDPVLPTRDTVIMRGEEILVGGFLCEVNTKEFEIIGYGIAKKSDYKKGYYFIKLKPKQTMQDSKPVLHGKRPSKPPNLGIIYHDLAVNATGQKVATIMPSSIGGHCVC